MFVSLGLSGVVPVIHGAIIYGFWQLDEQMGLRWVLLQGALYIFGAFLYAVSEQCVCLPPLFYRSLDLGTLARTSVPWNVRYLGELAPDISHVCAIGSGIASIRHGQGL